MAEIICVCGDRCEPELHADVARLRAALVKINEIRNSIVGYQAVNWSAHVYPVGGRAQ